MNYELDSKNWKALKAYNKSSHHIMANIEAAIKIKQEYEKEISK